MSFSKTINYIIIVESFFGVSRNWNFTAQRSWKLLFSAAIWTVASFSVEFLIGRFRQFYHHGYSERVIRINVALTTANAILSIIWGTATSKQFEELLYYLSKTHSYLKPNPEYVRNNLNLYTAVSIILLSLLVINSLGSVIVMIIRMKVGILDIPFEFYWIYIAYMACLIRASIDYLLFYCILKVISVQLKFIGINIREIGKKIERSSFDEDGSYEELRESLDKVYTTYIHSCNSCRLANTIFSVPVIIATNSGKSNQNLELIIIYNVFQISVTISLLVLAHIIIAYGLATQNMSMVRKKKILYRGGISLY